MKSILDIRLIVPVSELWDMHTEQKEMPADLCLYLQKVDEQEINDVYQFCFAAGRKNAFSISIHDSVIQKEGLVGQVIPLFNHPNYLVRDGKPEFVLIQEENTAQQIGSNSLHHKTCAQGWQGLHLITYSPSSFLHQMKGGIVSIMANEQSLGKLEELKEYFPAGAVLPEVMFLIKADSLQQAQHVKEYLYTLERDYYAENKDSYSLFCQYIVQKKEIALLNRELQQANTALENQKTYTEILRSQNETERILKFYHAEYETLPLWFKRLGHIVKVVTGKRKLKTLFGNHINTDSV